MNDPGEKTRAALLAWMRHPAWRLAALGVLVGGLFVLASAAGLSPDRLRHSVESWGVLAPLAYCVVGALFKVGFAPLAVVAGGAGLMFGLELGFPVALVAATSGAGLTFTLGRWLGREAVDQLQGERVARVRSWISERGLMAVIGARIAPIPSPVVNYAGGLTTLPLSTFLTGSFLGFAPRTFAYVALGGSLATYDVTTILEALALLAVVVAVGTLIVHRQRLRGIN